MDNQQFQPTDTNQINQSSEPAQKPKFNLRYILIIGILAAIAAAGTIFYTRYTYNRIDSTTNFPELKILPKTENTDTASWQTYRNEKYGFEFKYPSDFQLEDSSMEKLSGNDVFLKIKKDNNTRFIIAKNFTGDYVGIGSAFNRLLGIDINKKGVNIINESNNPLFHVFNALSATSTITVENSQLRVKGIIVGNGTDNVGIRSNYADDDSKLLDQILSTFKFIEPVDTAGWKTYTFYKDYAREKAFQIKYPGDSITGQSRTFGINIRFNSQIDTKVSCSINILPYPYGVEDPDFKVKEIQDSIIIDGVKWGIFMWKWDGEDEQAQDGPKPGDIIFYEFYRLDDENYSISVNPNDKCTDQYKEILSTFKFIK